MIKNLRPKPPKTIVWALIISVLISQGQIQNGPLTKRPLINDKTLAISIVESNCTKKVQNHVFGKNLKLYEAGSETSSGLAEIIKTLVNEEDEWVFLIGTKETATKLIKTKEEILSLINPILRNKTIFVAIAPITSSLNQNELKKFKDSRSYIVGDVKNDDNSQFRDYYVGESEGYIDWLEAKGNMHAPENLWLIARALTQIISSKTLNLKAPTKPEENYTKNPSSIESVSPLFHTLTNNISLPIDKKPRKGKYGIYGYENVTKGNLAYPNWTIDEVLRYHKNAIQSSLEECNLRINFISWFELAAENTPHLKNLPPSFSNKQRWLDGGLKIKKQDGGNCSWYAHATALEAILINEGHKSPRVSATSLENSGKSFASVFNQLKAIGKGSISIGNGQTYSFEGITLRSCRGLDLTSDHTDFPVWIRKKIKATNQLLPSEWKIICEDLMKYEIANGRPVLLAMPFPNSKAFKNPANPNINGTPVMKKGFSGEGYVSHMVVVSGYMPDPENPNNTLFEFINSWGPNWANNGSAWVSSSWINAYNETFGIHAYSLSM